MARDDERQVGECEDAGAAAVEGHRVSRVGIFGRAIRRPPEMRAGGDTSGSADEGGDILRGVAGSLKQENRRGERVALGRAARPDVTLVDSPVVVEAGIGEEGGVEGMVRVVM